ncbi:MAG TPA: transcription termination/antitermination NusG family protein [Gammaproteobacteria bacterium]|nr:transcription termination/antitermination NusG family protein [Gammaproteobacteria bacterium]
MRQWYVVHTQSQKEWVAYDHLLQQGFEVYLPSIKTKRSHARKIDVVKVPLFPRYLFIQMGEDSRWRSVNGTRGVSYILSTQHQPLALDHEVVEKLRSSEVEGGVVELSSLCSFVKGDQVWILAGSFQEQMARFERLTDNNRALLLLNFMGLQTQTSVPLDNIEKA